MTQGNGSTPPTQHPSSFPTLPSLSPTISPSSPFPSSATPTGTVSHTPTDTFFFHAPTVTHAPSSPTQVQTTQPTQIPETAHPPSVTPSLAPSSTLVPSSSPTLLQVSKPPEICRRAAWWCSVPDPVALFPLSRKPVWSPLACALCSVEGTRSVVCSAGDRSVVSRSRSSAADTPPQPPQANFSRSIVDDQYCAYARRPPSLCFPPIPIITSYSIRPGAWRGSSRSGVLVVHAVFGKTGYLYPSVQGEAVEPVFGGDDGSVTPTPSPSAFSLSPWPSPSSSPSLPPSPIPASFAPTLPSDIVPARWSATGLPPGLAIDQVGTIWGSPERVGSFQCVVRASNKAGSATFSVQFDIPSPPYVFAIVIGSAVFVGLGAIVILYCCSVCRVMEIFEIAERRVGRRAKRSSQQGQKHPHDRPNHKAHDADGAQAAAQAQSAAAEREAGERHLGDAPVVGNGVREDFPAQPRVLPSLFSEAHIASHSQAVVPGYPSDADGSTSVSAECRAGRDEGARTSALVMHIPSRVGSMAASESSSQENSVLASIHSPPCQPPSFKLCRLGLSSLSPSQLALPSPALGPEWAREKRKTELPRSSHDHQRVSPQRVHRVAHHSSPHKSPSHSFPFHLSPPTTEFDFPRQQSSISRAHINSHSAHYVQTRRSLSPASSAFQASEKREESPREPPPPYVAVASEPLSLRSLTESLMSVGPSFCVGCGARRPEVDNLFCGRCGNRYSSSEEEDSSEGEGDSFVSHAMQI